MAAAGSRRPAVLRRLNSLPSAVETPLKEGHNEGSQ